MTSVKVYNGEFFERGQMWYVIFATVFGCLVTFSLIYKNYIGAIVLVLILGGYLFFSATTAQSITITINPQFLQIGEKRYPRNIVQGFTFEVKTLKSGHEIRNMIFIINNSNYIHTLKDETEKIRDFVGELSKYSQLLEKVNRKSIENITRSLKLG